ncbi:MAG: N-acetylglucosamine-6-phosphate deacetylase [Acidobacteriota bacterium]|nr:N-acetylglucosamine-6-phosphate deacetylase [Acidobacteriota bacterium]
MMVLAGADLVLPDRVVERGTLVIRDGRIEAVEPRAVDGPAGATRIDCSGQVIVPGFIDVHVHGIEGIDALDGAGAVAAMASRLPKYGVTAFCPTSVACGPATLATLLAAVAAARRSLGPRSARVLPAHLESNFINPDWNGAQPRRCLRLPPRPGDQEHRDGARRGGTLVPPVDSVNGEFSAGDILDVIRRHRDAAGIITLAPELPGGLELVRALVAAGHRVSIGHTGASYDEAKAAIEAGACQATHLFNRMSAATSRSPGVVGAVLESDAVAAEIICDGVHVHPALVALAMRAKTARRLMAITDGTAGSGLPPGSRARLGEQEIVVTEQSAQLADGTLAGSVLTMDGAFRRLVQQAGVSLTDAARLCSTTPAAELGLAEAGAIAAGHVADLVVLGPGLAVRRTYVAGSAVWEH